MYHLSPGALPGGYVGVDIFFVISGFLITSLLLKEHARVGHIDLGDFWRRRARRLLPALGIVVLTCCTAAVIIGGDVLVGLGQQIVGAATFSSNWVAIAGERSYFTATTPELFRNLWSLAVEEQFYLVWPLVIVALLLLRSPRLRVALVGLLATGSALAMAAIFVPGADATRVYYGTDTHSFGLAIGAMLALAVHAGPRDARRWPLWQCVLFPTLGLVSVGGLVAASALMSPDTPFAYHGGLVLVAVLSAIVIFGSLAPGSLLGRMLDAQPMRWIGERSYGLYLWHWPVFVLVVSALPDWQRTGPSGWYLGAIAASISVSATALSYRYVEQPIRVHGFRGCLRLATTGWRASPLRLAGVVAASALVLGAGATTAASVVTGPEQGAVQTRIEQGQDAIAKQSAPSQAPAPSQPAPPSLPGGDQITAIGDSVMLASAKELQHAFPGIHIDALVSRQLAQAPALIQALKDAGTLRPTVLLGLGTNGPIDLKVLKDLRAQLGNEHQIVVVNVYAPRWWTDGVNTSLSKFAQQYRDVELANWRDAISGQLGLLARDQIHPGDAGGRVYVGAVRDALQRLSELPPLLTPRDYGLAPLPI